MPVSLNNVPWLIEKSEFGMPVFNVYDAVKDCCSTRIRLAGAANGV